MELSTINLCLWAFGCGVSFLFSIGKARVWTSIAVGFSMIFWGEIIPWGLPFFPGLENDYMLGMAQIVGILSVLVISHGFQEYYVFTRALEFEGSKSNVYLVVGVGLLLSLSFLLINPTPDSAIRREIRIVENTIWVFLSLINIDLIRKIYLNIKDTPVANGFIAFIMVFFSLLLWKGSQLYIDIYKFDLIKEVFPLRFGIATSFNIYGNFLSSILVVFTFLYLGKLQR